MNIFVTDSNPLQAAFDSCDSHSSKMCVEVAQMLSAAIARHIVELPNNIYKPTHKNHPCTIWSGDSRDNFEWVVKYGLGLCDTYSDRYGKTHNSKAVIAACKDYSELIPEGTLRPFAVAINVPAIQSLKLDAIAAYRVFIAHKHLTKRKIPTRGKELVLIDWKRSVKPKWLNEALVIAGELVDV